MKSLPLWVALVFIFSAACSSKKVEEIDITAKPDTPIIEEAELKPEPLQRTTLGTEVPWSYTGATGPENWSELHPSFALCGTGERQSPINLVYKKPNNSQEIIFDLRDSIWTLMDRDPFAVLQPGRTNSTYFSGTSFILKEVALHTPAEHTFSGKRFPLEVTLYHESEEGETLIVSTLYKEGNNEHPAIQQILRHIPLADEKDFQVIEPLSVGRLLPEIRSYYHYMGSLSYPPCTEGIHRVVFNTPMEVTSSQLAQLRELLPSNSRSIQPLNGRPVENYPSAEAAANN